MAWIDSSGKVVHCITLSYAIRSFKSTSDDPLREKVFANLVQKSISSILSNDFKFAVLKEPKYNFQWLQLFKSTL
jgi:hypothetical protein